MQCNSFPLKGICHRQMWLGWLPDSEPYGWGLSVNQATEYRVKYVFSPCILFTEQVDVASFSDWRKNMLWMWSYRITSSGLKKFNKGLLKIQTYSKKFNSAAWLPLIVSWSEMQFVWNICTECTVKGTLTRRKGCNFTSVCSRKCNKTWFSSTSLVLYCYGTVTVNQPERTCWMVSLNLEAGYIGHCASNYVVNK